MPVMTRVVSAIHPQKRNFSPVLYKMAIRSGWFLMPGNITSGKNNMPPTQKHAQAI